MVVICGVSKGSYAEKAGLQKGDRLLTIDSHPIRDVLDYRFFLTETKVKLEWERAGERFGAEIRKPRYADLGLEFDSFLMDEKKSCRNKCVFCFVDQNPKGMRESVYFKDDDTRLSFLMGNYVTLTNTTSEDLKRIREMRLSPVNVSVHTTDGELRKKLLGNRFAGDIMEKLAYLAQGGIKLNCQLVLCRGLNDGDALDRTLEDLWTLYPAVESVAAVPAGLTGHREGLYALTPYDAQSAREVLARAERFQKRALAEHGTRFVFCSDEFYLMAGIPIPPGDFYEGYPQLDNGVGSIASMAEDLEAELSFVDESCALHEDVTVFTGEAAFGFIREAVEKIRVKTKSSGRWEVLCAENRFFGGAVTVAGLLTGSDIVAAARGHSLAKRVILPAQMLRSEGDLFLDDMTPGELGEILGCRIQFAGGAEELVQALTSGKEE